MAPSRWEKPKGRRRLGTELSWLEVVGRSLRRSLGDSEGRWLGFVLGMVLTLGPTRPKLSLVAHQKRDDRNGLDQWMVGPSRRVRRIQRE